MKELLAISKSGAKTVYGQPREIGYFSFDRRRRLLLNSRSSLNSYNVPTLPNSLDAGYPQSYIKRGPLKEHLDPLLACLSALNAACLKKSMPIYSPQFVTWRGVMTRFLTTPYDSESWNFKLTRVNDIIYICEGDDIDANFHQDQDRFMYYGYKFESLCTTSSDVPSDPLKVDSSLSKVETFDEVNTNVQFCSVYKTRLGSHDIIQGAEIDCLDPSIPLGSNPSTSYIELKTNKVISNPRQKRTFLRYKALKIWAQSFLAGVPTVVIGYRDNGTLVSVEKYQTLEFPRMVRDQNLWDPNVCLAFTETLLDWIKLHMTINNPDAVYLLSKLSTDEVCLQGPVDSIPRFLPLNI